MKYENRVSHFLRTVSMIGGSVALIGIVVGLYFQILPEKNLFIRYAEMGFFSLCIPVLLGAAWQNLKTIKCTSTHLKAFLVIISIGLFFFLAMAKQSGGILSYEFLAVIVLIIIIIVLIAVGAEPIGRMVFKILPFGTNGWVNSNFNSENHR